MYVIFRNICELVGIPTDLDCRERFTVVYVLKAFRIQRIHRDMNKIIRAGPETRSIFIISILNFSSAYFASFLAEKLKISIFLKVETFKQEKKTLKTKNFQ